MTPANKFLLIACITLFSFIFLASAVNFGDPSPDTGEADYGANLGTFGTESGNATDTRTNNNIYFAVGRDNGVTAAANQTLSFNISRLSTNSSIKIIGINVSITYCHARTTANTCTGGGGASPQGTAGLMNISIYNASDNSWFRLGTLNATTSATEITLTKNLTSLISYGEFNNTAGFVNISFEFAWTGTGRSAFLNDHTNLTIMYDAAPITTLNSPANNALVNSSSITFNCSATDDFGLVNITLYHNLNSSFVANQTNFVGGTSNSTTFTLENVTEKVDGLWNCLALDNNNLSSFATANFTIDTSFLNITPMGCTPPNMDINQTTICNATITDNTVVTVMANVTLPNSTRFVMTVSNTSSNYFFNFSNTTLDGRYNVSWIVNDTLQNNKTDNTSFFTVGNIAPTISLISPANGLNTTSNSITFTFNVTDDRDANMSCSLVFNGTIVNTNASTLVNITSSFSRTNLGDAQHNWSINCTDSSSLTASSQTRRLNIDNSPPEFGRLITDPDDPDGLDTDVDILVKAEVSDNITAVNQNLVFLEFKRTNQQTFTQAQMTFNSTTGFFQTTINQNTPGVYNLRVRATDIIGNEGVSEITNITLVKERTWIDLPFQLVMLANDFGLNGTDIYTVNNTGDLGLRINITSNYSLTFFNETEQFNIVSKAQKPLNVTATAGTSTLTRFMLTTTAVDAEENNINGEPPSRTTRGTVVVAPGQPVLLANIENAPLSVTQNDTGVVVEATLSNIGEGEAVNVSFNITLPSGWIVTSGNKNLFVGNMSSKEMATIDLEITISTNAGVGNVSIIANASGFNATGTPIDALELVFFDERIVTVIGLPGVLGPGGGSGAGAGAGAGAAAAGGPQPFVPPTLVKTLVTEEFIKTVETIEVVRAEEITFPLKITNVFGNTTLSDITLSTKGYLSQYVDHKPFVLNDINYASHKNFTITLAAPGYFTKGIYNIIFEIKGKATGKFTIFRNNTFERVNTLTSFVETRNVTLIIYELPPEIARAIYTTAEINFQRMQQKRLPLNKATKLMDSITKDYKNLDWQHMETLAEELGTLAKTAILAQTIIQELNEKIKDAEAKGLDTKYTKKMVALASAALNREDFETARKRAEEGRLIQFLEVKGAFNALAFLARHWLAVLLGTVFSSAAGYIIYRKILIKHINTRIKNLITEELEIIKQIKGTQEKCFTKRELTVESYHKLMYEYEARLEKIKTILSKLRTKRVGILLVHDQLLKVKKEETHISELVKELQESYFIKKNIGKTAYDSRVEEYRLRTSELEEERALLETKLGKLLREKIMIDNAYLRQPTLVNWLRKQIHLLSKIAENTVRFLHGI